VSLPNAAQLGAAIRHLRKADGLSIEALAAKADVHWTSVSDIENRKRNPGWETVVKLAAALEVDMGDLSRLAAEQPRKGRRRPRPKKSAHR
jgi:transcriptional regulator with XRE-family HTH domain